MARIGTDAFGDALPRVFPLRLVVDLAKQPVMRLAQLCAKAHNFLISEMIVPGSTYWNIGIGREPGDVEKDAEGIQTMKDLGRNLAWLLKKIQK